MSSNLLWLIVGLVVGLVIAWLLNLWYWLRRVGQRDDEIRSLRGSLAAKQQQLLDAERRLKEKQTAPDDLQQVEGIGPRIAKLMQEAGITTFAQLADSGVSQLQQILEAADPRLIYLADPVTWPEQARLAADGAWDALKRLQDELKGGRRV
jgi:predicted flap endonuclease-1-like 5' DNA nuclease